MGFDTFVIQLVCLSCIFLVLRAAVVPRGWVVLAGAILGVTIATFFLAPAYTVWLAGGLWLVLILIPLLGMAQVNRLVAQEQYRQASHIAGLWRWLHPLDGLMEYPALLHGLDLGQQGRMEEALQVFRHHQTAATANGRMATMLLYRMGANWQEALQWMRQNLSSSTIFKDTSVGIMYLRSLGETGDLNGLLHDLERFERELEKAGDRFTLSLCRMLTLAFCGQTDRVQAAFEGVLAVYPQSVQQFWLATAELANGNEAIARQTLRQLRDRADVAQRHAIDWRLAQTPVRLDALLADSSRKTLFRLRTDSGHEQQLSFRQVVKGQKTYAVYALIFANIAIFALQISLGGSSDPDVLYRLGALVPEQVLVGEWWRCLTANFLHLNLLHLLANMFGLYLFGRFVEAVLGTAKFLATYFISGMGAMLTVAVLGILAGSPDIFCVGASGAVMGLVGVMGAIFLHKWRRENIRFAARQLRWILVLVALQVISDLFNPEVSLVGHISGLILGFLSGYVLLSLRSPLKPHLER
jgi:rhomboid protease GluP